MATKHGVDQLVEGIGTTAGDPEAGEGRVHAETDWREAPNCARGNSPWGDRDD